MLDIGIEYNPQCGESLKKLIAAILDFSAITQILDHLGLSSRAPPRSPAQVQGLFDPV
ncbi:hypothetical protein [Nitrosomonas communis]|uniref:Uncharacterized protein n=1 Tax=Nitrosomonas communis TaxID=44574 RepID=A0A1I4NEP5_9PROT|nr:hypothetical protein [Nitrosomonas communis]SFM13978.1 hypothetical protein SAMN05421863_101477 [Nitrosomonas communis]